MQHNSPEAFKPPEMMGESIDSSVRIGRARVEGNLSERYFPRTPARSDTGLAQMRPQR